MWTINAIVNIEPKYTKKNQFKAIHYTNYMPPVTLCCEQTFCIYLKIQLRYARPNDLIFCHFYDNSIFQFTKKINI